MPAHSRVPRYLGPLKYRDREVRRLSFREVHNHFKPRQRSAVVRDLMERIAGVRLSRRACQAKLATRFYRNKAGKLFLLAVDIPSRPVGAGAAPSSGELRYKGAAYIFSLAPDGKLGDPLARAYLMADHERIWGYDARIIPMPLVFDGGVRGQLVSPANWKGYAFTKMFSDAKDIVAKRLGLRTLSITAANPRLAEYYASHGYQMRELPPVEWTTDIPAKWIGTKLAPWTRQGPRRKRRGKRR